jgi:tetrahydromethanopterin S-methyltransferase subunit F
MICLVIRPDLNVKTKEKKLKTHEERLFSSVLWLNAKVLGLALGLLFGLVIFIATNWLVIKGGKPVGPHLQLLSQYFIGYRVSFLGSIIGFAYGFAVGTLSGAMIGWIYNKIAALRG